MKITNSLKCLSLATLVSIPSVLNYSSSRTFNSIPPDEFVSTIETTVPPKGTTNSGILNNAPSSLTNVAGTEKRAKIVVDLSKNILYKYNDDGDAEIAYSVASGKPSTPTSTGVRTVTHIETYPYRTAPYGTKRRKNPNAYGPKILCLNKVDTMTGEQSPIGEFIHGNNNPESIGKYASHGCIRMDNEIIVELANEIKAGDIVIMIR